MEADDRRIDVAQIPDVLFRRINIAVLANLDYLPASGIVAVAVRGFMEGLNYAAVLAVIIDDTLYYLTDANMNVTAVVDATSGEVVERYAYDSYGKATILDGTTNGQTDWANDSGQVSDVDNRVMYSGYHYDAETGLYHVRNRMYHPTLGRFIHRDPIGYEAGDPNLYRYVFNNPVNAVDPSGEFYFTHVGYPSKGNMRGKWPNRSQEVWWGIAIIPDMRNGRPETDFYGPNAYLFEHWHEESEIYSTKSKKTVRTNVDKFVTEQLASTHKDSDPRYRGQFRGLKLQNEIAIDYATVFQIKLADCTKGYINVQIDAAVYKGHAAKDLPLKNKNKTSSLTMDHEMERKSHRQARDIRIGSGTPRNAKEAPVSVGENWKPSNKYDWDEKNKTMLAPEALAGREKVSLPPDREDLLSRGTVVGRLEWDFTSDKGANDILKFWTNIPFVGDSQRDGRQRYGTSLDHQKILTTDSEKKAAAMREEGWVVIMETHNGFKFQGMIQPFQGWPKSKK